MILNELYFTIEKYGKFSPFRTRLASKAIKSNTRSFW